jgi:hypothetical protein
MMRRTTEAECFADVRAWRALRATATATERAASNYTFRGLEISIGMKAAF